MKAARCRISGIGEFVYEWNKSSGRRTGAFGVSFADEGAAEPKESPASSVVFVFWPKSEKARVFLSVLDSDRLELGCCNATREKALAGVGALTLEACEHLRQT
jgi:hypothetical protein